MILNPAARVRILSGGKYTMSLHPSGVVHWVPEQLNIKAVTGACKLMVAAWRWVRPVSVVSAGICHKNKVNSIAWLYRRAQPKDSIVYISIYPTWAIFKCRALETYMGQAARQAGPERAGPKRAGLTNQQRGTDRAFSSNGPASIVTLPVSPTVEAPSKKRHLQDFEDGDGDEDEERIVDEVSRYSECRMKPAEAECILGWWKKNSSSFPKLATVARFISAIPSSSAASARSFSAAGQTISDRRTNLPPDTVDDILFVLSNSQWNTLSEIRTINRISKCSIFA